MFGSCFSEFVVCLVLVFENQFVVLENSGNKENREIMFGLELFFVLKNTKNTKKKKH